MNQTYSRRDVLRSIGVIGLGLAAPHIARANTQIRIASNPGLENATLNALMEQQGFFKRFGVDAMTVLVPGPAGPFDAIVSGKADLCMVSGYNMVLSRIEQGAKVKIIGAGMRKCALTVYSRPDWVKELADLRGKTVAVGPSLGLLHALMLQLLRSKGIDASQVNFVNKGSNEQCYESLAKGEVDACCSSISYLNNQDGLAALGEGNMWQALPQCIFQTAYASEAVIRDNHQGMMAVMAAYGALYDYLMSPGSRDAFVEARRRAQKNFDAASAQAIWNFNQSHRPYAKDLSLNESDITYLQDMFIGLGSLKRKQPMAEVADMRAARDAAKLLG